MKLWDDELESYREEARSLLAYLPDIWPENLPADPVERAVAQRESMRNAAPPQLSERRERATLVRSRSLPARRPSASPRQRRESSQLLSWRFRCGSSGSSF